MNYKREVDYNISSTHFNDCDNVLLESLSKRSDSKYWYDDSSSVERRDNFHPASLYFWGNPEFST